MFRKMILAATILTLATGAAVAQTAAKSQDDASVRGFVSVADFGGSFSSGEHVIKLDTAAGYNFSEHLGVDFGVPFYFAGGSSTSSTGTKTSASATGLGAPYFAVRAMYKEDGFQYGGRFAVFLPMGDNTSGLATGNSSFDWNNHFEDSDGRFTPYGEIGVGNTVVDSRKYNRPFSVFGDNFHVEGGATVDVTDKIGVGGSAFDIFPWGTQAIYSRVLPKFSKGFTGNGNSSNSRAFEQNSYTVGTSDLGKDKGASAWVDFMPAPYLTAEVAYTRSIQYAMNTMSVNMRLDIGYLSRHRAGK